MCRHANLSASLKNKEHTKLASVRYCVRGCMGWESIRRECEMERVLLIVEKVGERNQREKATLK